MAKIALHPRPRPPQFGLQDWHFTVTSDAGGRTPPREVRVRYQHPAADDPDRMQRDGVVLVAVTLFATVFALMFLVAMGPQALFGDMFTSFGDFVVVALPLGLLVAWWVMSARLFLRTSITRNARHTIRGVVVERSSTTWRVADSESTYDLYYLAVDDGAGEQVEGWEVPREVYDQFPLGTEVEADVSGDGRYPYSISHAT